MHRDFIHSFIHESLSMLVSTCVRRPTTHHMTPPEAHTPPNMLQHGDAHPQRQVFATLHRSPDMRR